MYETAEDLAVLQRLLDDSYAVAGPHLRRIITAERRLPAEEVVARLSGMRLLALATVTSDGRPIVGPVDGIFYRGAFHFGSSPDSVRFRHIRARPHVSATHLPGEELAVTVHGRAEQVDVSSGGFRPAHGKPGPRPPPAAPPRPRAGRPPAVDDVVTGRVALVREPGDRALLGHP